MNKKIPFLVLWVSILLMGCSKTDSPTTQLQLQWKHSWGTAAVSSADLNQIQYPTAHGERLSVERLRYLVSQIVLVHQDGRELEVETPYFLMDLSESESLQISLGNDVPVGNYSELRFVFGFLDEDNLDGVYPDLNTANWNVPAMLGGGYHYLQLDGKFQQSDETPQQYNYHMIRAADRSDPDNLILQETAFEVVLGAFEISEDGVLSIEMQLDQWFQNPYTWDLTQWNTMLMPNFNAQLKMKENGATVFRWYRP